MRTAEGVAMKVVTRHTTIPSPRLLDMLQGDRGTCLIMTRLSGAPLGEEQTLQDLCPEQLQSFEDILREWFAQLRSIPVPDDAGVSAIDGGSCFCYRVDNNKEFGPFPSYEKFYDFLLQYAPKRHRPELREKLATISSPPHRLVFCHADIQPANFLIQDGRLVGWIDWECAGWYPEYWDYTTALFGRVLYRPWYELFTRIFPQYGQELEVEQAFWEVTDPW